MESPKRPDAFGQEICFWDNKKNTDLSCYVMFILFTQHGEPVPGHGQVGGHLVPEPPGPVVGLPPAPHIHPHPRLQFANAPPVQLHGNVLLTCKWGKVVIQGAIKVIL